MASEENNGNKTENMPIIDMPKNVLAVDNLWVPKDWCIMVYLAGGLDISDEARECLLRMKQVGSTPNIHLVAQFDSGSEGTFTKRYYLNPHKNAVQILMLLEQACIEVVDTPESYDDAAFMDYYQRLWKNLSKNQRNILRIMPREEMRKLLISSQDRFKNFVLNCVLDEDIYPRSSGNLGDTNAGEPEVLVNFIRWAKARYPAKNYMVVLWGHGSGLSVAWDSPPWPITLPGDPLTAHELLSAFETAAHGLKSKFISEIKEFIREEIDKGNENIVKKMKFPEKEDVPLEELINPQIRTFVEEEIKKKGLYGTATQIKGEKEEEYRYEPGVDIVGFNSCSLATIEVYRQLSELVKFVVASEGFTPKTSWPYDEILKTLNENSGMKPGEFAKKIVIEYIDYYRKTIKTTEKLKKLEQDARQLGVHWNLNDEYDLRYKGPWMRYKGPWMRYKGPWMRYKGPWMRYKGPWMGSEDELESGGTDLSACCVKETVIISKCMRVLVDKLMELLEDPNEKKNTFGAVMGAHSVSQSFFKGNFTDLYDFCHALSHFHPYDKSIKYFSLEDVDMEKVDLDNFSIDTIIPLTNKKKKSCKFRDITIRNACDWVMQTIKNRNIIAKQDKTGEDVRNSKGVSIFFPWGKWEYSGVIKQYKNLKFLDETNWHNFLKEYRELAKNFETKSEPFK